MGANAVLNVDYRYATLGLPQMNVQSTKKLTYLFRKKVFVRCNLTKVDLRKVNLSEEALQISNYNVYCIIFKEIA